MQAIGRRLELLEVGDRLLVIDEIAVFADRESKERFGCGDSSSLRGRGVRRDEGDQQGQNVWYGRAARRPPYQGLEDVWHCRTCFRGRDLTSPYCESLRRNI